MALDPHCGRSLFSDESGPDLQTDPWNVRFWSASVLAIGPKSGRSTASTLLNESGKWSPDAIERALAHKGKDLVRAAYHRGAHWQERVLMAQWWGDYLDRLRMGGEVVPLARQG